MLDQDVSVGEWRFGRLPSGAWGLRIPLGWGYAALVTWPGLRWSLWRKEPPQ